MIKAKSTSSTHATSQIDPFRDNITELFTQGSYIFNKYIEDDAELCVNVSYDVRQPLQTLFRLSYQHAFQDIYQNGWDQLNEEEKRIITDDEHHRIRLIKTYLYHCFDRTFDAVWALLRDDVFLRFQATPQFQQFQQTSIMVGNTSSPSVRRNSKKSRTSSNASPPNPMPTPIVMDTSPSFNNGHLSAFGIDTPIKSKPVMLTSISATDIDLAQIADINPEMKFNSYSDEDELEMDGLVILEPDKIEEEELSVDNIKEVKLEIKVSSSQNDIKQWKE